MNHPYKRAGGCLIGGLNKKKGTSTFSGSKKKYWNYYPHRSRDSLSPVCGKFTGLEVAMSIVISYLFPFLCYFFMYWSQKGLDVDFAYIIILEQGETDHQYMGGLALMVISPKIWECFPFLSTLGIIQPHLKSFSAFI